jgi:PAS domain S-box-containing protein
MGLRHCQIRWLGIVALVWAAMLASYAHGQTGADDVLHVVARPSDRVPPIVQFGPDGSMTGFQIELLRGVAGSQSFSLEESRLVGGASVRAALVEGGADVIPLMVVDDSTKAVFALSDPAVSTRIVVFARTDSPVLTAFSELAGKRVVAVGADIAAARLTDSGIGFTDVATTQGGFEALSGGEADYFVETELGGRYALVHHPVPLIGIRILSPARHGLRSVEVDYAVATLKGDPRGWIPRINRGLAAVRVSGQYDSLYRRWLEPYAPLRVTAEQARQLQGARNRWNADRVRVGVERSLAIAEGSSEAQPAGYLPDLFRAAAARMGKSIELEVMSISELRQALSDGRIDVIAGASYSGLDILRMDFGRPVEVSRGVVVHRADEPPPSEIAQVSVAVVNGSAGHAWAVDRKHPEIMTVDSTHAAVSALSEGSVGAVIMTELEAQTAIASSPDGSSLRIGLLPDSEFEKSYTFAVASGQKPLLWDLEDSFTELAASGERRELEERWFGAQRSAPARPPVPLPVIMGLIAGLTTAIVAAGFWVTTLRRELNRRTERLRHEEARLKAITESVPALVYGYLETAPGVRELRYFNRRLEEWALIFPALVSGNPLDLVQAVHPSDRGELERRMEEGRQSLRRIQQEIRVLDRDGNYRWIQMTIDPDPVSEGVLWHGIVQDATDLRLATEALAQSERNFRQIFEATQDAILVFGAGHGRILEANRAACDLYGYSRDELLAMEASELFDHAADLAVASEQGASGPFRHRRKDGATIDVECGSAVVQYGGGPAMLSVNRDVTSRTRFEEHRRTLEGQMLQAQKMESLGLLAGGIAHDFNNLLVGIMGNASLARSQAQDREALEQTLDQIVLTTRRASDLTQQLLAYAGRAKLSVQAVDLSAVAAEMVKLLGSRLSRGAKMVFSFSPLSVVTLADPVQIRQIVMNLLTNASDALKNGEGVITIRTGVARFDRVYLSETYVPSDIPEGEYAFIEVADDGCGIDPDLLPKIFDPFYTTKFVGRGLGLSVALAIVQRHRGAIKVFSERDRGTVFRLLLPLAPVTESLIIEPKPNATESSGT